MAAARSHETRYAAAALTGGSTGRSGQEPKRRQPGFGTTKASHMARGTTATITPP